MKIVMTLLVRDEADILDEHLAFHLNAGVDYIIATDHRSVDGTTEILRSYAHDGYVRLIREDAERIRQSEWMTRMARLAAIEHGADWVLNSDADEFWWPRGNSLQEVLSAVPDRCGVVHAVSRSFVPRPDDGTSFWERMTIRLATTAPINDTSTPFRPVAKAAHRADPRAVVGRGNHDVHGVAHSRLDWSPIELLHFPLRSPEQCARKYEKTWRAWEENLRGDITRARALWQRDRLWDFWRRVVVDDAMCERGLTGDWLVSDTRLRDALRRLAVTDGLAGAPHSPGLVQSPPTLVDDVRHAVDRAVLREADVVRTLRRVDELARRLASQDRESYYEIVGGATRAVSKERAR